VVSGIAGGGTEKSDAQGDDSHQFSCNFHKHFLAMGSKSEAELFPLRQ
jgi:hypothetical protein